MTGGDIFGVFAYPDRDAVSVKEMLFDRVTQSDSIDIRVEQRSIAYTDNQDYLFSVYTPELNPDVSEGVSVTASFSCIVLRRPEGGVLYAQEPGRDEYIDLFVDIYEELPERPAAGYLMDGDQSGGLMDDDTYYYHPVTRESLANDEFNDAAWVMLSPPAMVDQYGERTLRNLSARRLEELDDGSFLVVASGDPTVSTEWRQIAAELNTPATSDRPF